MAALAGLAAPRLADAFDVAGVAAGVTTGSPAEPLRDAVLRRAGRADPEDVTMGFLREARVYREMDCYYMNAAHELRMYCDARRLRCQPRGISHPANSTGTTGPARAAMSGNLHCQQHMGEEMPSVLSRGTSHCIIPHDAVRRANDRA